MLSQKETDDFAQSHLLKFENYERLQKDPKTKQKMLFINSVIENKIGSYSNFNSNSWTQIGSKGKDDSFQKM